MYNCRKVYCKGERLRKCTFEIRIQPPKPKIARKMKQSTDNMQLCGVCQHLKIESRKKVKMSTSGATHLQ